MQGYQRKSLPARKGSGFLSVWFSCSKFLGRKRNLNAGKGSDCCLNQCIRSQGECWWFIFQARLLLTGLKFDLVSPLDSVFAYSLLFGLLSICGVGPKSASFSFFQVPSLENGLEVALWIHPCRIFSASTKSVLKRKLPGAKPGELHKKRIQTVFQLGVELCTQGCPSSSE